MAKDNDIGYKLKIQAYADRMAMVMALINSGYTVTVQHIKEKYTLSPGEYWVIIEKKVFEEIKLKEG